MRCPQNLIGSHVHQNNYFSTLPQVNFETVFHEFPLIRVDVNTVDKMKADVKKAVDAAERRHLVRTKPHSGAMMADPERL